VVDEVAERDRRVAAARTVQRDEATAAAQHVGRLAAHARDHLRRLGAPQQALRRPARVFQRLQLGQRRQRGRGVAGLHARAGRAAQRQVQREAVAGRPVQRTGQRQRALRGVAAALLLRVGPGVAQLEPSPLLQPLGHGRAEARLAGVGQRQALGVQRRRQHTQQRGRDRHLGRRIAGLARPCERIACVVQVGADAPHPAVDADAAAEAFVVLGIEHRGHRQRMAPLHGRHLARGGELLERVRAGRVQQAITRHRVVLGIDHGHQRPVDQAAQHVEHRPFVEVGVGRHLLDQLQRGAARDHAEAAEDRLLAGIEKAMAPLQRGTQGLLALRRRGVAARGQQPQPLLHPCGEPLHAEHGRTHGGQLDRQRQAVERTADLDHGRHVGIAQLEPRVDRQRAFGEQRDGAERQRLRRRQHALRHGQGPDAHHPFDRQLERHLARHHQAQARRGIVQRAAHLRHVGQQVLGVVQRHEHRERRHRSGQRGERLAAAAVDAQRRHDGAGQRGRVGHVPQLDPAHAVRIRGAACGEQVLREQRLADAARAHDADQPVPVDQHAERGHVVGAAEQRGQLRRQVGAQRRMGRRGGGRLGLRERAGQRHHGRRVGLHARGEAVAPSGNGGDDVAAQHLAQRADLRGDVVFLHDEAGPHTFHQHVLADQRPGALGQRQQQVERTRTQRRRHAVHQQPALVDMQFEAAESKRGWRRGHGAASNPRSDAGSLAQRPASSHWRKFQDRFMTFAGLSPKLSDHTPNTKETP
jgi:hypothetical protein